VELDRVMRTTPATREFTDEPVEPEALYQVLERARFAPSGGNRQGWRVIVVEDPDLRRMLRDLYVMSWREYMAHVNLGLVPFAPGADGRWERPAVDLEEARETPAPNAFADHLDEVPAMLVLAVDLSALAVIDNGLDRQSIVGGASVYPFAHNILLAARDLGLGGVVTTVLAREEPAAKHLLDIPPGWAVAALIVLGHPRKEITRLRREPVESFTRLDRFDGPPFTGR
jgi:nitroreductase